MHLHLGIRIFLLLGVSQPSLSSAQETQHPVLAQPLDSDCHNACTALVATLDYSAFYDPLSSVPGFRDEYYSTQQRDVVPACIVTPSSPIEVAQAIGMIREHNCIFAVKSGGHAMFVGASNAPGGVTIDLRKLNDIVISEDLNSVRVGPGNRWKTVYEKLEPLNRTVVGGRMGDVGVGGFILGGGISFVSRRYGWALDNVQNFQVVLANGTLTNVNRRSSPDLYWALRGGGNNFGIVTNFDLEVHPQGDVWGGQNFWLIDPTMVAERRQRLGILPDPMSLSITHLKNRLFSSITRLACMLGYCMTSKQAFKAFRDVVMAEQSDPYAQVWLSFAWASQINQLLFGSALLYSKPEAWPPVFNSFNAPQAPKSVWGTGKVQKFTKVYEEVTSLNEIGYRQMWATVTFKMSEELLEKVFDVYLVELESIKQVKDVIPSLVVQPINKDEISIFKKNGGNCLGLEDADGPLIMFAVTLHWSDAKDDERMNAMGNTMITKAVEMAKEMGLHHRFIYQNYANSSQDVFAGYGEENRAKLRDIQRKYDPQGVFSRLQPGYFKV